MPVLTFNEAADFVIRAHKIKHRDSITRVTEQKLSYTLHLIWQAQKTRIAADLDTRRILFEESSPRNYSRLESFSEALAWSGVWDRMVSSWDKVLRTVSGKFQNTIQSALTISYRGGSAAQIADVPANVLPVQFSLPNEAATQWSATNAARLVSGVDDTTRNRLRTVLTNARENGWAYTKTADEINAEFDGFSGDAAQRHIRDRAQLVAVTESCDAYEAGSYDAIQTLQTYGLVYDKSWLAAGNACPDICAANMEQGWIPVDDSFQSGDDTPSGHPGCRCSALYQRREEEE
jgi:hypothetical protein